MSGITKNLPGAKRIITAIVGGTVVLIGVVLLVLPGPGLLVIALGLALLATEFAWAEGLLRRPAPPSRGKKKSPTNGTSQNRER